MHHNHIPVAERPNHGKKRNQSTNHLIFIKRLFFRSHMSVMNNLKSSLNCLHKLSPLIQWTFSRPSHPRWRSLNNLADFQHHPAKLLAERSLSEFFWNATSLRICIAWGKIHGRLCMAMQNAITQKQDLRSSINMKYIFAHTCDNDIRSELPSRKAASNS
ncbi:hypothetical protein BGZ60DRAFT_32653 [Tricladium varicosporioides]|nr:hypothetical protein BGZ60DRAFT_32653 [Hymenoscyphus varicosporioides]